jgi:hypothetical protein
LRDLENGGATETGGVDQVAFNNLEAVTPQLNRKLLLDLRDSLRSFLTLLEGK